MLISKSCLRPCFGHAQGLRFMYTCCVCYERICRLTHRVNSLSYKHRHGWSMINHKCHACHSHRHLVLLSMCVWMVWVVSSSSHVGVCLQDHMCIFYSFTNLVILLKFRWSNSPLTARPSPHHWLNRLSTREKQKHQEIHFKLRCLQTINQPSSWSKRGFDPAATPGLIPLKNCAEDIDLSYFGGWENCANRPDRHPVPILVSLRTLCNFSSQSSRQLIDFSSIKLHSFHENALCYCTIHLAKKFHRDDQKTALVALLQFPSPIAPNKKLPVPSRDCTVSATKIPTADFLFPLENQQFLLPVT